MFRKVWGLWDHALHDLPGVFGTTIDITNIKFFKSECLKSPDFWTIPKLLYWTLVFTCIYCLKIFWRMYMHFFCQGSLGCCVLTQPSAKPRSLPGCNEYNQRNVRTKKGADWRSICLVHHKLYKLGYSEFVLKISRCCQDVKYIQILSFQVQ